MKISINQLRNYIELPSKVEDIRTLMEAVGLEVKRAEQVNTDTFFTLELLAGSGNFRAHSERSCRHSNS